MSRAAGVTIDAPRGAWATPLDAWYRREGRHHLPWRLTRDPWAVLVSEVMLQQTSVGRVLPRWRKFLTRWPDAAACADATLEDVLREWSGLGYPRRAKALWSAAAVVSAEGWPVDEAGLCRLPGVGPYTARALLSFAFGAVAAPPRDTNLARVAARAAIGVEAHQVTAATLDGVLTASRPKDVDMREHAYALFDLGATVCVARAPRCPVCPLTACASRARLRGGPAPPPPRRQPAYAGSTRQLRGAVLRAALEDPGISRDELVERIGHLAAARRPGAIDAAIDGLRADGLLPPRALGGASG